MNYRMIVNVLGWILLFESLFLAIPAITALVFRESEIWAFLLAMAICGAVGVLLVFRKPKSTTLYTKDGFVIVALSWITLSLFGTLPLLFSPNLELSFIDALFETVSGFTTTGATVFPDVEVLPRSILMWRAFTHWIGGMGVLVFIMAFLPLSGGQNMHIMKAESTGPDVGKLVPRVRTTAMILYTIYIALTLLEMILLLCGGMSFFDALCTSFSTAGTGGFGNYNDSCNSFSPYIQIVITVFMFLFSVNFNCFYLLLLRRFRQVFNAELRTFIGIVLAAVALIMVNSYLTYSEMGFSFGEALRHTFFTVGAIISTTGFSTVDFTLLPVLSQVVLVCIMLIGACAGSTGGGFKVSRILILFKSAIQEIRHQIHPKEVRRMMVDKHPISDEMVRSVNSYLVCYIGIFALSLLLIGFETFSKGQGFTTAFTSVATMLNNVGPGLEGVGPKFSFAFYSIPSKLVFIFDMLAGRLELFPMLLLLTPATWKK